MENLFDEDLIRLRYPAVDKKSLLQDMCALLQEHGFVSNFEVFFNEIWKRETIMSTGIGRGIAIPHTCHSSIFQFKIAVWQLAEPLPFAAIDDKPVDIVFLIAVPLNRQDSYMKVLSAISNFIRQSGNVEKMRLAPDSKDMTNLLKQINIDY